MVATRRGTRVDPHAKEEDSKVEQSLMEARRTRRSQQNDSEALSGGSSQDQSESAEGPTRTVAPKGQTRGPTTRRRHNSSQSDVSEAESVTSNSSARVTRRLTLGGGQVETTRTLRNRKSVVSEAILESIEDLSDAESNCSSVSTRARRASARISGLAGAKSQRPALIIELDSDASEAESHCSFQSGLQIVSSKSAVGSKPTSITSSKKEELSEAESTDSTSQPRIRRSTRSVKCNVPAVKTKQASEMIGQDPRSPKKTNLREAKVTQVPSPKKISLREAKVTQVPSPRKQDTILFSPSRSLRNRKVSQGKGIVTSNADSPKKTRNVEEKSSLIEDQKLHETFQAIKPNVTVVILDDEDQQEAEEVDIDDHCKKDDLQNQSSESVGLSLVLEDSNPEDVTMKKADSPEHSKDEGKVEKRSHEDSEDSDAEAEVDKEEHHDEPEHSEAEVEMVKSHKESEHSEAEEEPQDESEHSEAEESKKVASRKESEHNESDSDVEEILEESEHSDAESDIEMLEDITVKKKTKKLSARQLQDLGGDGLFVIDMAPGVDKSKKYHVEPEETNQESAGEQSVKKHSDAESDIKMVEDKTVKRKLKKLSARQLQDLGGDGLFVIDTAPGVDTGKKYYVDPKETNQESAGEQSEKKHNDAESDIEMVEDAKVKRKPKKQSARQLQDLGGDGLFVIDTSPGVDSSKKYYVEPEEANKKSVGEQSEKKHNDAESDIEMVEDAKVKRKPKKRSARQLQDLGGDGLFVIDTSPGVDKSKKYYVEPEEANKKSAGEQSEKKHSDAESDIEMVEEAKVKRKPKKRSARQLQDLGSDGLFVIDKAPGVDSNKKYYVEPEEASKKSVGEQSEKKHSDAESDIEMVEDAKVKRKPKKRSARQLQDLGGDGLFVIDKAPGVDSSKKFYVEPEETNQESAGEQSEKEQPEDEEEDFVDEEEDEDDDEDDDELLNKSKRGLELSTSIDTGLSIKKMGGLYINFNASKPNPGPSLLNKMKKEKKDELLKKSVLTPDFEKKEAVPPYRESLHKLKKMRKEERAKTTGQGWFDMKAPEITEELKNDLKALQMRSAMDPKRFYKKNDRAAFPKYFQVGTVVDNPLDYYHSRIPKKDRKRTIVEELVADSEFRRYNKKKYQEIMAEKAARAEGKKNRKKKKKFRT